MELAKEKLGQYVNLLQTNNGNECRGSIEGALAIYFDKIQRQFPELTTEPATTEPATAEPATAEPATAEPAIAEPAIAEPATAEPAAITNKDIKNIFSNLTDGTGKDTISLVKFIKIF